MQYQPNLSGFVPWQPSTWPQPPQSGWDPAFAKVIERIFQEAIIDELDGVVGDAQHRNGSLAHRGYVIGLGLLCAVDALASYAYPGKVGKRYKKFVEKHFPSNYAAHAGAIYELHRCNLVHSWHLFEASITAGNESVRMDGAGVTFGLLNFLDALKAAFGDFMKRLSLDTALQGNVLKRYKELLKTARP